MNKIDEKHRYLLTAKLSLLHFHNGEVCNKCGFIQGTSLKGFKRYYCKHLRDRINRFLLKEKKILTEIIIEELKTKLEDLKK